MYLYMDVLFSTSPQPWRLYTKIHICVIYIYLYMCMDRTLSEFGRTSGGVCLLFPADSRLSVPDVGPGARLPRPGSQGSFWVPTALWADIRQA